MGTASERPARRRSPASRPWTCYSRRRLPCCGATADAAARGTRPRAPRATATTGWTRSCTRPWCIRSTPWESGRRVIGQAALTGAHRWILQDSLDDWGEADEVLLEMKDQFCAGIQVMEEAALIDHVRSLFGQLGSSTAVVPHDPFLQDPIMKTIVCNSLDMPNSSHLIDLPGSVNTSLNDDRISHHFRHQMSPASMIQPFHSVQQFYAGATFCCPVTRASCCDFFQPLVQSDHTSTFLLNSQSEGNKSTVQLKNNYSYYEASHVAFLHVSSSLKESNIAISGKRKYLSIEQHSSCMKGGMEITKGDTAASGCTGEICILNKMDAVTSQDHSLDFQTSNATSVNRKFQTMSIADNTKHEDDSFASSDAPFIDSSRYSNCFQSHLGTLQGTVSSNSNAIHGETSQNVVSAKIL